MLQRYRLVDLLQIMEPRGMEQPMNHLPIRSGVRETRPGKHLNFELATNTRALRKPRSSSEEACDNDQLAGNEDMVSRGIVSGSSKASITDIRARLIEMYPHLQPGLITRLADAQHGRYSRLLKLKLGHCSKVGDNRYNSGSTCAALSGPYALSINQELDVTIRNLDFVSPQQPSEEPADVVITDELPQGVPPPPRGFLSTKVECPICFNVETFQNLNSWIKHVYEDIQPYSCTFSNCSRSLGYKRKADWMRHENGWHREAVRYTCYLDSCTYSTIRRSNFVPHMNKYHLDFMASLPPHTRKRPLDPGSYEPSQPILRDQSTVMLTQGMCLVSRVNFSLAIIKLMISKINYIHELTGLHEITKSKKKSEENARSSRMLQLNVL